MRSAVASPSRAVALTIPCPNQYGSVLSQLAQGPRRGRSRGEEDGLSGLTPIAVLLRAARLRLGLKNVLVDQTAIGLSGQSRKALLLLLCARIGYTPPASFQR